LLVHIVSLTYPFVVTSEEILRNPFFAWSFSGFPSDVVVSLDRHRIRKLKRDMLCEAPALGTGGIFGSRGNGFTRKLGLAFAANH